MVRSIGLILMMAGSPTVLMAYTDPGTGILVWQSVVAICVGFLYSTRRALARVFKRQP